MLQTTSHLTTWFTQAIDSLPWNPPVTPNCSVQGRIRSTETHKNVMKVRVEPPAERSGFVYEFTTTNPLLQSQLLVADLGNREISIKGKAPVIPPRGYPLDGGSVVSIEILGIPSFNEN